MWQFKQVSRPLLLCGALLFVADTIFAQEYAAPRRLGSGPIIPLLRSALRRDKEFAMKLKLSETQQQQLDEIDTSRREYSRSLSPLPRTPPAEYVAKMKEFDTAATNVLDDEQKILWETKRAEIISHWESRVATQSDRDRILALEDDVKALKAEIAKLKEANTPKP